MSNNLRLRRANLLLATALFLTATAHATNPAAAPVFIQFHAGGVENYPGLDVDCNKRLKVEKDPMILPPGTAGAAQFISTHHARLAGDSVDMNRLGEDIATLSGEIPIRGEIRIPDRETAENRAIVRTFLRGRLEGLGYQVFTEEFKVDRQHQKKKKIRTTTYFGTNLFVEIPGSLHPDEVVEVNAHYDTVRPEVPGADDNATGVSTVLEMARLFRGFTPERTLRFVFADLEEKGFFGTRFHAIRANQRKEKIVGALVVDMIGYFPHESGHFVVEVGTAKDFGPFPEAHQQTRDLANEIIFQYLSYGDRRTSLHPVTVDALPNTGDHGAYWRTGYPAVLIAAPFADDLTNPNYHKPTDRIHALNWQYLEDIARITTEGVACFAGASACSGSLNQALRDRDWYFQDRSVSIPHIGRNFLPTDPPPEAVESPAEGH